MNLLWEGEENIDVSKERVWAFVNDPASIAACMPDVVKAIVHDERRFDAFVAFAVGPVKGTIKLAIQLEPQACGNRMNLKIRGGGLGSVVDVVAGADVRDNGDETTSLAWTGTAAMRGAIARIGGPVIDAKALRMIHATFANVRAQFRTRGV